VEARLSPAHLRDHSQKVKAFLNASHATLGRKSSQQVELSIGRVPLRLHVSDAQIFSDAQERYRAFGAEQAQPFSIYVQDCFSENGKNPAFAYDFKAQHASLRAFSAESEFTGAKNAYALDSLLRILLSWVLLRYAGFLLHAATVVRNGRAYVFSGGSGAGKSTVAALSPAGSVWTDEISLLRREQGEWRAYGTPFWGEFRAAGSNSSAPVAGIFGLSQARENHVEALAPVGLLRNILPNVLFFSGEVAATQRLLEILGQAVKEIPGYNLAFRKDKTFWEALPS
jgi:hypothetical protein